MITADSLLCVGKVIKTHGIDGELSISFPDPGFIEALKPADCLIFDRDGIFVPFFIKSVRPRGAESLLVCIDGEDSKEAAANFVGSDVYMLADDARRLAQLVAEDADDADGLYAEQLVGYVAATHTGDIIGTITDIDDSTDNPLFIIDPDDSSEGAVLIPIVDDFITEIDTEARRIYFSLPEGLLNL